VRRKVGRADPEALITTIGGGMRVRTYLPTRTFELVVHSLDISAATGIDVAFSSRVLAHTTAAGARKLHEALAACREGDTLVVTKPARPACPVAARRTRDRR